MVEVFKSRPLLVEKVWGGRKLDRVFDKALPTDAPYGESWEVADIDEGQSNVASGELEGATLREAVGRWGTALIGTAAPDGRFPLLVKLLDAADDLSVQVHPGPAQADPVRGIYSKDECWLILDADPGAAIVHGFREDTAPAAFRSAVEAGKPLELLHRVPVQPGDVFRVPPGTIHAICGGVALLEIQQPSDTTYRVYDYGRAGLDGRPRPLHLEEALAVASFGPSLPEERGVEGDVEPTAPWRVLANVDAYRIEWLHPADKCSWQVSDHSAQIVHVLRGTCCIDDLLLRPADTAVIPAAIGRVWLTQPDECELVVAGLGGRRLIDLDATAETA